MAKAPSLENNLYPFGTIAKTSAAKLLSDDYPFKDFETYKFSAKTTNGASVAYKANFNILKKTETYSGDGNDELKITFPVQGTGIIARILANRKGELEGHVDFGDKKIADKPINFFANFKTSFDFQSIVVRAGANYFSSGVNSSTHVQTDLSKHSVWQRLTGKQNKASWGLATTVGSDGNLTQYDAVVGYEDKDFDVYAKHISSAKVTGIKPQVLSLEALYRVKDYNVSVVAQKDLASAAPIKSVEVGGSAKVDDKTNVKAKINKELNLGASVKYKHNDSYTFTLGANVPLATLGKGDSKGLLPFDLGLQIDLNV